MRRTLGTVALFLVLLCSTAVSSEIFFISITGRIHGAFKGESIRSGHDKEMEGRAFSYEILSPTDRASGLASGKRQHGPITITKEWGAASPQLFEALTKNEVLSKVVLTFVTVDPNDPLGREVVYQTITLTNARIIQMRMFKDLAPQGDFNQNTSELETISLSFEKIEIENKPGSTISQDNWRQQ